MAPLGARLGRSMVDSRPGSAVLRMLESVDRGRADHLAVLTYHRIAPRENVIGVPGLVSASPETFDAQLDLLSRRFRVVSLADILDARASGRPIGRRAVLLTVDDAHRDFLDYAWPALRRHGLPVTLFVPTAFPGDPSAVFWWDWIHEALAWAPDGSTLDLPSGRARLVDDGSRLAAYREVRDEVKRLSHAEGMALVSRLAGEQLGASPPTGAVLSWDELRDLAAAGVTLAPHSRTHPLLDRVEPDALAGEIRGSFDDLVDRFGSAPPAFAYPSGAWSSAVRDAVDRAGMQLAFTTRRGINRLGATDWLALRRINVGGATSTNILRAQLGRWAAVWS